MRILAIAFAALLLLPAAAEACGVSARAVSFEYAAAKKKKAVKVAAKKTRAPKVEYMRIAP